MDYDYEDEIYGTWQESLKAKAKRCQRTLGWLIIWGFMAFFFLFVPFWFAYLFLSFFQENIHNFSVKEKLWTLVEAALSISPIIVDEMLIVVQDSVKRSLFNDLNMWLIENYWRYSRRELDPIQDLRFETLLKLQKRRLPEFIDQTIQLLKSNNIDNRIELEKNREELWNYLKTKERVECMTGVRFEFLLGTHEQRKFWLVSIIALVRVITSSFCALL